MSAKKSTLAVPGPSSAPRSVCFEEMVVEHEKDPDSAFSRSRPRSVGLSLKKSSKSVSLPPPQGASNQLTAGSAATRAHSSPATTKLGPASSSSSSSSAASGAATTKVHRPGHAKSDSSMLNTSLRSAVVSWRNKELFGKEFTVYKINSQFGGISWNVEKRFSEFAALHTQLLASDMIPKDVRDKIPKLPSKSILQNKLDPLFIRRREVELDQYIKSLVAMPAVALSPPMLAFVGALENHVHEEKDVPTVKARVRLEKFMDLVDTGDIILFRTDGLLQSLQRSVLASGYDHVGIIARNPPLSRHKMSLRILEATQDGVKSYPLRMRLVAWDRSGAQMVLRKLTVERDRQFCKTLGMFLGEMHGKEYGLNAMNFVRRVSVSDKDSYFCSEVVAAGYKRLGLLPADVPSNSYLPSSFAAGSDIKLLKDAELGPELLLIFSEPGVAKASLTNDYVEESTELESSMSSTAAAAQAAMRSSVTYNSSQSRSAVSTRSSVDSQDDLIATIHEHLEANASDDDDEHTDSEHSTASTEDKSSNGPVAPTAQQLRPAVTNHDKSYTSDW